MEDIKFRDDIQRDIDDNRFPKALSNLCPINQERLKPKKAQRIVEIEAPVEESESAENKASFIP